MNARMNADDTTPLPFDPDPCQPERVWLAGTLTRMAARHGRALAALAELPARFAAAALDPDGTAQAPGVRTAAEGIHDAAAAAIRELEAICEYAWAAADPGPARCRTCGGQLCFPWALGGDCRHWRRVLDAAAAAGERTEFYDPGHDPAPVFTAPERPDWTINDDLPAAGLPDDLAALAWPGGDRARTRAGHGTRPGHPRNDAHGEGRS